MKEKSEEDRLVVENLHRKVLDTEIEWKEKLQSAIERK
jgi:hypothetical protein